MSETLQTQEQPNALEAQAPDIRPGEENFVHDPVQAEVMAYAGKEHREKAVALANMALDAAVDGRDYINKEKDGNFSPYLRNANSRHQEITTKDALELAKEHNGTADRYEFAAGKRYVETKEKVDAIKNGTTSSEKKAA